MRIPTFSAFLAVAGFGLSALASDPTTDTDAKNESNKKQEIHDLIVADAQKNTPAAKPGADNGSPARNPVTSASPPAAATPPATSGTPIEAPVKHPEDSASLLPKVEVSKSRVTDLDIEINQQQRAIDREKVNAKPTKLDSTLNGPGIAKSLSIFGGSSSEQRSGIAQERVQIMEEEKEVLESLKTAQSKEERDELKQELEVLRQSRRELDQK